MIIVILGDPSSAPLTEKELRKRLKRKSSVYNELNGLIRKGIISKSFYRNANHYLTTTYGDELYYDITGIEPEEEEFEEHPDFIEIGDKVDFGAYGRLYVVRDYGEKFWVTDLKSERHNPDARGWNIERYKAKKILEKG